MSGRKSEQRRAILYDSTLREGAQSSGVSFSVSDKLRIAAILDELGVPFIEGGMPESNPKDDEFYRRLGEYKFKNAEFVPFGATKRVGLAPDEDQYLRALAELPYNYVCVYGKTDIVSVEKVLKTDGAGNISIIEDTCVYLTQAGKKVIFDCENYFAGLKSDREYTLSCVAKAAESGVWAIVLCDSRGGADPDEVKEGVDAAKQVIRGSGRDILLGVHMHNDAGMADANSLAAVLAGAEIVNTTLFGLGERCGNADFFTTAVNLQLREGYHCLPDDKMTGLTSVSYTLAELLNIQPAPDAPFVGRNSFAHKAGTHINAVNKAPGTFEIIDPAAVGNTRRILASEITGTTGMRSKLTEILGGEPDEELCAALLGALKEKEFEGYQYESAEASLEMLVKRLSGRYKSAFDLNSYKVIVQNVSEDQAFTASAIVDMTVDGTSEITAANGIGPVDALDRAFRRAMGHFYPETLGIKLIDYRVRVIDSPEGTASKVRVFIEFIAGDLRFGTVGVSGDIIQASWNALVDAYEFWIDRRRGAEDGNK